MRKLITGIVEFREKMLPQYAKRFRDLALVPRPRGCWCVSLRARDKVRDGCRQRRIGLVVRFVPSDTLKRERTIVKTVDYILFVAATLLAVPAFAQGKPADKPVDNMQILREKLKADKKLVVAANMELTEAEAKGFWPVYEEYQKELQKINERMATTIVAYAKEYNAKSLTDEKATKLLNEALGVEESEIKLKRAFVPKLSKALPGRKVARYIQIENKIRAIVKYEIAAEVPLAP